jgi:hypothetical protein
LSFNLFSPLLVHFPLCGTASLHSSHFSTFRFAELRRYTPCLPLLHFPLCGTASLHSLSPILHFPLCGTASLHSLSPILLFPLCGIWLRRARRRLGSSRSLPRKAGFVNLPPLPLQIPLPRSLLHILQVILYILLFLLLYN